MKPCQTCSTLYRQNELHRMATRTALIDRDRWRRLAFIAVIIALAAVANAVWAVTR